ncbi:MAG: hypothetical protein PHV68_07270 [Candidatus Gastranaerophilales bacterium]|nr:hypothetical protein [Candidatus Gastranaerophilales bacterium]
MGFAALNMRLLMLTKRQSTLELQLMQISNRRQVLAIASGELGESIAELMQEDKEMAVIAYESQSAIINAQDSLLESKQKNLETELKAVSNEVESVEKQLEKNAKQFAIFG